MKYTIPTIVLGVVGFVALGASEIHAQRAGLISTTMRGTVSALSQQQLASARRECEPLSERPVATVAYCAEVQRTLESQPLQVVVRPPAHVYY